MKLHNEHLFYMSFYLIFEMLLIDLCSFCQCVLKRDYLPTKTFAWDQRRPKKYAPHIDLNTLKLTFKIQA